MFLCSLMPFFTRFSTYNTKYSIYSFYSSLLSSSRDLDVYSQTGFGINWFNSDISFLEPAQHDSKSTAIFSRVCKVYVLQCSLVVACASFDTLRDDVFVHVRPGCCQFAQCLLRTLYHAHIHSIKQHELPFRYAN